MPGTTRRLAGWKSAPGKAKYAAAYDAALSLWPVPYVSQSVPTRYGSTHVIISGPVEAPPLVLLHAAGLSATQWFANAAHLTNHRRIHAVDFVGGPGKGTQTRAIIDRTDCASWLTDLLDSLQIERADLLGSSQGGWFALNLALSEPDRVGDVVLLAPAASLLPFRKRVEIAIRLGPYMPAFTAGLSMRAMFKGRYEPDELLVKQLAISLKYFRYQEGAVFPDVFADDALAGATVRLLILLGDEELIYDPREAAERARRLIPGAEVELVPNAGHLLGMERADFVDSRILGFVTGD